MIACFYRPLVIGLLPIALIACVSSGPTVAEDGAPAPLGVDLGSSGLVAATPESQTSARGTRAGEDHAPTPQHRDELQMAHAGHNDVHGTINSVDPTQHKINLSHQAIPDIGWPAMTMEFPVAASVDLKNHQAWHARDFHN
jgi:hypothetical protein